MFCQLKPALAKPPATERFQVPYGDEGLEMPVHEERRGKVRNRMARIALSFRVGTDGEAGTKQQAVGWMDANGE